ncbi:MAG: hypothetical protein ABRQ33_00610, partial [Smithellaceae bacterium]
LTADLVLLLSSRRFTLWRSRFSADLCVAKRPLLGFIDKEALFSPIKDGCQAQFTGKSFALIDIFLLTSPCYCSLGIFPELVRTAYVCISMRTSVAFLRRRANVFNINWKFP